MEYNIYALGIMTAIISFLGFVVENMAGTDKGIYKQSEYEYAIFIGLWSSYYVYVFCARNTGKACKVEYV